MTDATGQIETKLANGEYKYTVSKAGYEATVGKDDDATGTVTVNGNAVATNITYSPKSYNKSSTNYKDKFSEKLCCCT